MDNNKDFEKLIHDGLDAAFDREELTVSEDLISRTLSAIKQVEAEGRSEDYIIPDCELYPDKEQLDINTGAEAAESAAEAPVDLEMQRQARRRRNLRIVTGIAAAVVIGVFGIKLIKNSYVSGLKEAPAENTVMADYDSSAASEEACMEASEESMELYDVASAAKTESAEDTTAEAAGITRDSKTFMANVTPAGEDISAAEEDLYDSSPDEDESDGGCEDTVECPELNEKGADSIEEAYTLVGAAEADFTPDYEDDSKVVVYFTAEDYKDAPAEAFEPEESDPDFTPTPSYGLGSGSGFRNGIFEMIEDRDTFDAMLAEIEEAYEPVSDAELRKLSEDGSLACTPLYAAAYIDEENNFYALTVFENCVFTEEGSADDEETADGMYYTVADAQALCELLKSLR